MLKKAAQQQGVKSYTPIHANMKRGREPKLTKEKGQARNKSLPSIHKTISNKLSLVKTTSIIL